MVSCQFSCPKIHIEGKKFLLVSSKNDPNDFLEIFVEVLQIKKQLKHMTQIMIHMIITMKTITDEIIKRLNHSITLSHLLYIFYFFFSVIQVVLMLIGICCWLFWFCCYMSQMNPLIGPILNQRTLIAVKQYWVRELIIDLRLIEDILI